MAPKPKSPPVAVSGDVWGAAHKMLRGGGPIPGTRRTSPAGSRQPSPAGAPRHYGLGAGPPGTGPAPPPVIQPGGQALFELQSLGFRTVERLQRNLPEEGWFDDDLTPSRPFVWTILAYKVPKGMALWLTDYEFSVGRQSGIDAGDIVYAEDGRFSGLMGFDVAVNGLYRVNDIEYGLDPMPIPLERQEYDAPLRSVAIEPDATPDEFNFSAANSFGSPSGIGTSLLPVRSNVQGPRRGPFTIVVGEGDLVALRGAIFRTVSSPIAFVQARLAGFTLHTQISHALLERTRPA